jgi:hypothetical protein
MLDLRSSPLALFAALALGLPSMLSAIFALNDRSDTGKRVDDVVTLVESAMLANQPRGHAGASHRFILDRGLWWRR